MLYSYFWGIAEFFANHLNRIFNWSDQEKNEYIEELSTNWDIDEDLKLVHNYTGPTDKQYTYNQIVELDWDEVTEFANLLGFSPDPYDLDRNIDRILRILSGLGLIWIPNLTDIGFINSLCENLSVDDLNNYRLANMLESIQCQIKIFDPDDHLEFIYELNDLTYHWIKQIEQHGSNKLITDLIESNDNDQLIYFFSLISGNPKVKELEQSDIQNYTSEIRELSIQNYICKYLSFETLNIYRVNNGINSIKCKIRIDDLSPDVIEWVNELTDPTYDWILRIKKEGSYELLKDLVINSDIETIEYFFSWIDGNVKTYELENLLMVEAAKHGNLNIIKWGINQGIDPNGKFKDQSPLYKAAKYGYLNICQYLVEVGADIYLENKPRKRIAMFIAARNNHFNVVNYFMDLGIDVNYRNSIGFSVMFYPNDPDLVNYLVDIGGDINRPNMNGITPIFGSMKTNDLDVVKAYVDRGADINHVSLFGTPIFSAIESKNLPVIEYLIQSGAWLDIQDEDDDTPLTAAIEYGHYEVVELLINNGIDINLTDEDGDTPLMYLKDKDIGELLIKNGADVNNRNDDGTTPLIIAASSNYEMVDLLIKYGADVNAKNNQGGTPISGAVYHGLYQIVKLLINSGAYIIDEEHIHILRMALENGDTEFTKYLGSIGVDFSVNYGYTTPLILALEHGDLELAQYVLDRGSQIKSTMHVNPLILAIEKGYLPIVQRLLRMGFDLTSLHHYRDALNTAVSHGELEITEELLKFGADSLIYSRSWDLVIDSKNLDMAKLLMRWKDIPDILRIKLIRLANELGDIDLVKELYTPDMDRYWIRHIGKPSLIWAISTENYDLFKFFLDQGANISAIDTSRDDIVDYLDRLDDPIKHDIKRELYHYIQDHNFKDLGLFMKLRNID